MFRNIRRDVPPTLLCTLLAAALFVAPGAADDCNGNGIPDECDVSCDGWCRDVYPEDCGRSADCNRDGIPDECQFGGPAVPQYTLDAGDLDVPVGMSPPGAIAWLNQFTVEPNGESLKGVRIAYGFVAAGTPVTIHVWRDPDGNGNPSDAQPLVSVDTTVTTNPGEFVLVEFPEVYVGPTGTSFFVGAILTHQEDEGPAALDVTYPQHRSWVAGDDAVDPDDLGAASLFGRIDDFGLPGNWLVRAVAAADPPPFDCNGNGVLDECDIGQEFGGLCEGELFIECSTDCNENGIPDECEDLEDCDENGIPDVCQVTMNGVIAEYWVYAPGAEGPADQFFDELVVVKIDPVIDLGPVWEGPYRGFPAGDSWAARWTGTITTPDVGGEYRFNVLHDDGMRLWVNGQLLIDYWRTGGENEHEATIALEPETTYYLRLEFLEDSGYAYVHLRWQVPGGSLEVVPSSALRPSFDRDDSGVPDTCELGDCNRNGMPDPEDISTGLAPDCNGSGVPDECEDFPDCDDNGVPDACQALENGLVGQYFQFAYTDTIVVEAAENWDEVPLQRRFKAQIDPVIDFDFVEAPPGGGKDERFAIRWTGSVTTPDVGGLYTFGVDHDDGIRLYVNGRLLIDNWGWPRSGFHTDVIHLLPNQTYDLRLEYWQDGGGAYVQLLWQPPDSPALEVIPTEALRPLYDSNDNGVPDRCEYTDDCNGNGVPDVQDIAGGLSIDCDGDGVPDECQAASCQDCDDNGILDHCEDPDAPGLTGQYWRGESGCDACMNQRVAVRFDENIDFEWGDSSPFPDLLGGDRWTVRWTGTLTPPETRAYQFRSVTDDGCQVWLDGNLILRQWPTAGTETSDPIYLETGTEYLFEMLYFEAGQGAYAHLYWGEAGVPWYEFEIIPPSWFQAMADADGDGMPDTCGATDCNENGVPDVLDIAAGTSGDCNDNCVPDECESSGDCNGNGVPDLIDIFEGTSEDCNGNCVPDECDIVIPPFDYGQGYWRFEEGDGSTALDSSPHGLDGALQAAGASSPSRVADVAVDPIPQSGLTNSQSLDLDYRTTSSGGFVTVPDSNGLLTKVDQSFTIEAWVKLDQLCPYVPGQDPSPNQRQYLCLKKTYPSEDGTMDYAVLAQGADFATDDEYGLSGRELVLRMGAYDPNSATYYTRNRISTLAINDLDWNFVSVAWDADREILRFGINDRFESMWLPPDGIANDGPLTIGAHFNSSGAYNHFLRGSVDEVRISRRFVPVGQLLISQPHPSSTDIDGDFVPDDCEDCNGNGVPDNLDIADGTSADCNGNGLPDECDIWVGYGGTCVPTDPDDPFTDCSSDCNGDGVPDECCPGDLDGDADVDLSDLAELLGNYRTGLGATFCDGDLDGDGDVDLSDLAALLPHYGTSCE